MHDRSILNREGNPMPMKSDKAAAAIKNMTGEQIREALKTIANFSRKRLGVSYKDARQAHEQIGRWIRDRERAERANQKRITGK